MFFFSSRRRHTRLVSDWSSDVCSSDLIQESELNRIHSDCFRHLIHHLFPAELEFLLHIASGWPGLDGIGPVLESDFLPIRDHVDVKLRSSSTSLLSSSGVRTIVDMKLTLARDDAPVLRDSDLEFLDVRRLHLHVREFLVLWERQPERPVRLLGDVSDPWIEPRCSHRSAKSAAIPFVDESNIGFGNLQSAGEPRKLRIDALPHSIEREFVAFPFGHAANRLEGNGNSGTILIGEFLDDVRLRKSL